ncbi:hypothetical protein BH695_1847 [Microcystis aeruginosa PCC 7806SL]|uniref:Uncharacterized protein n=1 Tax=Microcystis aeruginosa PCC 7806SL TaxID=1903187 RepID=A0AB33BZU8_MICA7|nr:hypothetical protein BH695_1847 [Microcystis aeruginosa PCC 7806SL]
MNITALPIRSNRISWKLEKGFLLETLFLPFNFVEISISRWVELNIK